MIRRLVVLAAALGLIATACGGPYAADSGATTLAVGATAEPPTLDPTVSSAAAIPQVLLYNVYQTLVKLDGQGRIKPLLARSWRISRDRRTYTFSLQPDAHFSNGDPLRAQDVVYSIDRVLAPKSTHPFKAQMQPVARARAAGAHTLLVRLKNPSNNWLFNMTGTVGIVFDRRAIGAIATAPVGSGPFVLGSWVRGTSISLDANPRYWADRPSIRHVVFRYFTDPNAMNNYLLTDQLDVISNVQAPQTIPEFGDRSRFRVTVGTTTGEVVLGMNDARGPLRNKLVRQAICYAIDRKALLKTVWSGYGTLIGSMVPPTDPWYQNLSGTYPYDPQKARELLAKAGYAKGFRLQMKLPTLPYATASGQFVASELKAVGIDARISQLEFPARWLDVVFTKGEYDLSIISHVEPRDIVNYGNPKYYWHYDNATVRSLLARADSGTPRQQIVLMRKVARILADDAASDWLFLLPNLVVARKSISGFPKNAASESFDLTGISKAAT